MIQRANQPRVEILPSQLPLLVNSLIVEHVMGFERRLGDTGLWEWRGKKEDGTIVDWSDELPFDFVEDPGLAIALVERICLEQGLFIDTQFSSETKAWALKWGRPLTEDEAQQMRNHGEDPTNHAKIVGNPVLGKPLGLAFCLAVIALRGLDLPTQHALLFPQIVRQ